MNSDRKREYIFRFSAIDAECMLIALGRLQQHYWDTKQKSKRVEILIDRIYRSIGSKL